MQPRDSRRVIQNAPPSNTNVNAVNLHERGKVTYVTINLMRYVYSYKKRLSILVH